MNDVSDIPKPDLLEEAPSLEVGEKPTAEGKKARRKSNRPFPPTSFEEACTFCLEVFQFGAGKSVRKMSFFQSIDKSPTSSTSRDWLTSANKYKLTKASYASETIDLTEDAKIIFDESSTPISRAKAIADLSIGGVDVFSHSYGQLVGSRLPAQAAVVDIFRSLAVPEDFVEEGVDLFLTNLRFSGLLKVIAGAERVISYEDLFDALPKKNTVEVASSSVFVEQMINSDHSHSSNPSKSNAGFDSVCFYIAPIGAADSIQRKHSDLFLGALVEPAVEKLDLKVVRADAIDEPGVITGQIIEYILKSKLVVVDLSFHNPNVFYELALRHAVRKPIVQIIRKADSVPFDINQMRTIQIDDSDIYTFTPQIDSYRAEISAQARRALEITEGVATPISVYFPSFKAVWD